MWDKESNMEGRSEHFGRREGWATKCVYPWEESHIDRRWGEASHSIYKLLTLASYLWGCERSPTSPL